MSDQEIQGTWMDNHVIMMYPEEVSDVSWCDSKCHHSNFDRGRKRAVTEWVVRRGKEHEQDNDALQCNSRCYLNEFKRRKKKIKILAKQVIEVYKIHEQMIGALIGSMLY